MSETKRYSLTLYQDGKTHRDQIQLEYFVKARDEGEAIQKTMKAFPGSIITSCSVQEK